MGPLFRTLRFMRVVPPLPALLRTAFVAVGLAGAVAIVVRPESAHRAVIPVLVLQAFAASTGFSTYARRGHYDLLLTGGCGRVQAALVQWIVAVAPGVATWLALAAVETATARSGSLLASGTIAALFVVSAVAWASTVGLPRFSGAVGWLLLAVMGLSLAPAPAADLTAWRDPAAVPAPGRALLLFVCPILLAGQGITALVVLPSLALATAGLIGALVWIHRTSVPLQAGQ